MAVKQVYLCMSRISSIKNCSNVFSTVEVGVKVVKAIKAMITTKMKLFH